MDRRNPAPLPPIGRPLRPILPAPPRLPDVGGGGAHIGGAATYVRPQSFTAAGVDYPAKGLQVQTDLSTQVNRATPLPDDDHGFASKIGNYGHGDPVQTTPLQVRDSDGEFSFRDNIQAVFDGERGAGNNIDGNVAWRRDGVYPNAQDMASDTTPVSKSYHNKDQRTIIVSDSFNDELPDNFPADQQIFHSEFWFQAWKKETGPAVADISRLKYVVRSNIYNTETKNIIRDGRAAVGGADPKMYIIRIDSTVDAEKDVFNALAGSKNGKQVFRMLTDHSGDFNKKTVLEVHVYDGITTGDNVNPSIVWVLSDS